jgi:hypothetical protein
MSANLRRRGGGRVDLREGEGEGEGESGPGGEKMTRSGEPERKKDEQKATVGF